LNFDSVNFAFNHSNLDFNFVFGSVISLRNFTFEVDQAIMNSISRSIQYQMQEGCSFNFYDYTGCLILKVLPFSFFLATYDHTQANVHTFLDSILSKVYFYSLGQACLPYAKKYVIPAIDFPKTNFRHFKSIMDAHI